MAASAARRSGSRAAAERPRAPAMLETAARPAITIATTTTALADLRMHRLPANESNAACRGNVDARPGRRAGSRIFAGFGAGRARAAGWVARFAAAAAG